MKIARVLALTITLGIGVLIGASVESVEAAFFDRDKLAQALSARFNLHVNEVSDFLADFQYNPNKVVSTTPTPQPTSTPEPSLAPTPSPSPASYVQGGVTYSYDDGTDQYYPSTNLVALQHKTHLDFIGARLDNEVDNGRLSTTLKKDILHKLSDEMNSSPSTAEFLSLDARSRRVKLNQFGKTMDAWLKTRGYSLKALRDATGKGDQYLMGIYFD